MGPELRQQVWQRADYVCEYCHMPQELDPLPFGIDHIRPRFHHGPTTAMNLALACFNCNSFKAVNVAGYAPDTGELTPLFNPRRDEWGKHFEWDGARLAGKTAIGRTTVDVLRINLPERVEQRRLLIAASVFLRD